MLISGLCDYYDIIEKQGKVIPDGYSQIDVSYMISLRENGEINSIIDIREESENGKKKIPRKVFIIKRKSLPTIHSEIIEHRGLYIFGLNYDKDKVFTPNDAKDAAKKKHEDFVKTNMEFIEGIDSPIVNAFRNFILTWNPEKEVNNPLLISVGKDISLSNFVFCLSGRPEVLLHKDKSIKKKWENIFNNSRISVDGSHIHQCAILGENYEIAEMHTAIKGIRGGQPSGTKLICFNNASEESYGKEKSFNSNVSMQAMQKYTEALNYLLASKFNHNVLDDTTIVFWSQNGDEKADSLMGMLTFGSKEDSQIDDEILLSLMEDCRKGELSKEKLDTIKDMDVDADFYFVGIKPNASRLSVKFIYKKKLGRFLINSAQHQEDIKIIKLEHSVPLWMLKKELVSPKAKNEAANPALIAKLLESILNGVPYPNELLKITVLRVKTDTNIKINPVRAGIIKACINRKNRFDKKEEIIPMSLDKENTNQAYLCGRLFAILEQIQQKASSCPLNRTIKDSYFSSAASRPASIFPKIMKLSNYHMIKLGNPKYFSIDLMGITEKLHGEFPSTLSLTEQGKFILGYYHQMNNKKNNNMEDN